ncbi:envelope stress response regulator transcription factor CpxR [Gallibacterium anatis]|uniref:Transcriptional regulatory protein CpxR n=1 Tax=Gallibacterium anatis TaxID=750 RepID=A0AAX3X9P2_9PAST|nr:envelope stress response regulator transcription factor CpxR [Gallibacterium anatis]KGQ26414.1 transcriptional regulator [Gallibacterium anatis]KGQ35728.1 transcriptional regulator [Gallibacterium anatis]KGQ65815.1 transcriptional regulator [Gallibacterium anatis 7990]KGQ66734.1 transcriptional regulator [Gallibacterium anatis]MBP4132191.1 envelope stress response regulator transcription factor CpxR [Gallibacterium anatis]
MPKILLVDDDVEFTSLLAEVLAMESFEVEVVHNGEDALHTLDLSYDLILLDIMMPKLGGIETLKQIRQKYTTPVLMLTARGDDVDRILGLELGADDYLSKPFNDRELVARIKAILRRVTKVPTPPNVSHIELNNGDDQKTLYFDDIVLYPGRQQVIYQGKDLELTGTEFALLSMLIRNPGHILSRELLSIEILGKRLTPFDRAIDMHMSNLRKKLPPRKDNLPWFKTLRGRGYLLVTEQ